MISDKSSIPLSVHFFSRQLNEQILEFQSRCSYREREWSLWKATARRMKVKTKIHWRAQWKNVQNENGMKDENEMSTVSHNWKWRESVGKCCGDLETFIYNLVLFFRFNFLYIILRIVLPFTVLPLILWVKLEVNVIF